LDLSSCDIALVELAKGIKIKIHLHSFSPFMNYSFRPQVGPTQGTQQNTDIHVCDTRARITKLSHILEQGLVFMKLFTSSNVSAFLEENSEVRHVNSDTRLPGSQRIIASITQK
jgi:hypothetical protein